MLSLRSENTSLEKELRAVQGEIENLKLERQRRREEEERLRLEEEQKKNSKKPQKK